MSLSSLNQRETFLALMLLDALQDFDKNNVYEIMEKYNVNPSQVVENGLSPLHYAVGMDNEELSTEFTKYFLEGGANPNCYAIEHISPLHIAAINGRAENVRQLLKHGAKIDSVDDSNKTPLHYAIESCQYEIVEILREHIFLSKYEAKKGRNQSSQSNMMNGISTSRPINHCISSITQTQTQSPGINKNLLSVKDALNDSASMKLTPNRCHYNFDITSPYYINITHRRNKPQPKFPPLSSTHIEDEKQKTYEKSDQLTTEEEMQEFSSIPLATSPENEPVTKTVNVFSLTRDNLEELSRSAKDSASSRVSLIETWRKKVQLSRARRSILREFDNVGEMIDNVMKNDDLNFTNTMLNEKPKSIVIDSDGDSGACGSGGSTFIKDDREKHKKVRSGSPQNASLGRLIQKISQANLAASETFIPTSPNQINKSYIIQKTPSPSKSTTNTSYHSIPIIVDEPEEEKDATSADASDATFIRSPKNNEFYLQLTEAYEITDDENGLVFYETKLPNSALPPRSAPTPKQTKKGGGDPDTTVTSQSTNITIPLDYETDALRAELTIFGDPPGPITKTTKRLYIKRLVKYKRKADLMQDVKKKQENNGSKFSVELFRTLRTPAGFQLIPNYLEYVKKSAEYFANHKPTREMREGHLKQSFIYMLIDPRISCNLPGESAFLDKFDVWKRFLESIFYVGKGKSSRPYSHLYDAMKAHARIHNPNQYETPPNNGRTLSIRKRGINLDIFGDQTRNGNIKSDKLQKILDIWASGQGVVCLHVFHNITPIDAYTREASIIDALSLNHLTNVKRGDFYGPSRTWTMKEKKYLGIALLYQAMLMYLAEGESQLSPSDLI